jgi:predicted AlkP superfamily phosphohydrolase/phosphomutase
MSSIVIIGIDGMDYDLVQQWKDDLPIMSQMIKSDTFYPLESVFPPDSVPAWASIYTGLNPTEHGVLQHINYLSKGGVAINIDNFKGRTFWDIAGKRDKKVCIINPFLAYPVWPVNGVMINGPSFGKGHVLSFPETIVNKGSDIPRLGGLVEFPRKDALKEFIYINQKDVRCITDFAIKMFEKDNYDLRFVTFLNLDRVQHFLWRYFDEDDPTYPGRNEFKNIIKEYYILFDSIIGKMQEAFPDSVLLVLSDHGHGRRCTKVVNINEYLRQKGYLFSKGDKIRFLNYKFLIEKTKTLTLDFLDKYDMEDLLYKITPYIPFKKSLKSSSFLMNSLNNMAEVDTHFGGVNPFGGIKINKVKLQNIKLEYEDFRNQLINDLFKFNSGFQNNKIIKWIGKREDIYTGNHIELYPDVLFELYPDYGASPTLHTKLISKSTTHKKISGGHNKYGVLGYANLPDSFKIGNKTPSILQITPSILQFLNCF